MCVSIIDRNRYVQIEIGWVGGWGGGGRGGRGDNGFILWREYESNIEEMGFEERQGWSSIWS